MIIKITFPNLLHGSDFFCFHFMNINAFAKLEPFTQLCQWIQIFICVTVIQLAQSNLRNLHMFVNGLDGVFRSFEGLHSFSRHCTWLHAKQTMHLEYVHWIRMEKRLGSKHLYWKLCTADSLRASSVQDGAWSVLLSPAANMLA